MAKRAGYSALLTLAFCLASAHALGGLTTIDLQATRSALLADGKQTADLIADVRDTDGRPVPNGTQVQFQTTSGTLSSPEATAIGGIARVRLTSSPVPGVAHVTAFADGGATATIDVLFTDDLEATFAGNNYILVTGTTYTGYSATDRIIEADGRNAGARVTYRNIDLRANSVQVRGDDLIVRADDNVTLKRGRNTVTATRLYYSLQSGQGYALSQFNGRLQTIFITGDALHVQPSPTPIPNSYLDLQDLSTKLVIAARSIIFFPGDRLQFRRPRFYQDQIPIVSLPYYELGLHSSQLFSDQFISVGTRGLGLDLPIYYNLSPRTTGILYIRHQQQLGRNYYSTEPGWALDLLQGYSAQGTGQRYEGQYGFTGLTRGDWGFRWTHNEEFNPDTQGTLFLDFPHHNSFISSSSLTQQLGHYRWGLNLTTGQSLAGPAASNYDGDLYLETQPHRLGATNAVLYTVGSTFLMGRSSIAGSTLPTFNQTRGGVNVRAFTRPFNLNAETTFTGALTLGQLWSTGRGSGLTALSTLALNHSFHGGGGLNLTYDFVSEPIDLFASGGQHRLTLAFTAPATRRLRASIFGSTFLDAADSSLLADLSYQLNNRWRVLAYATVQRFAGTSFADAEFTIGRRIGARELQLTYSTYLKRVSFDFTATRF